jgi:recombinational DNA repair protein (RecF pathway)
VQGSRYNACTGKYCIICPGAQKKKKNLKKIYKPPTIVEVLKTPSLH